MSSYYPIYQAMQATSQMGALQLAGLALLLLAGWLLIRKVVPVKLQEVTRYTYLAVVIFIGGYSLTWI